MCMILRNREAGSATCSPLKLNEDVFEKCTLALINYLNPAEPHHFSGVTLAVCMSLTSSAASFFNMFSISLLSVERILKMSFATQLLRFMS